MDPFLAKFGLCAGLGSISNLTGGFECALLCHRDSDCALWYWDGPVRNKFRTVKFSPTAKLLEEGTLLEEDHRSSVETLVSLRSPIERWAVGRGVCFIGQIGNVTCRDLSSEPFFYCPVGSGQVAFCLLYVLGLSGALLCTCCLVTAMLLLHGWY